MELVLATHNSGKVREWSLLLSDLPITVTSLGELGITEEDPELGASLEANSEAKAKTAFRALVTKMCVLADDTGVEFSAFEGRPGVATKQWVAGREDPDEFEQFLRNEFSGADDFSGVFRTVITILMPSVGDAAVWQISGEVNGTLMLEGRGPATEGLPLSRHFIPEGSSKTLAEMGKDELAEYSHRGRALARARSFFEEHLYEEKE